MALHMLPSAACSLYCHLNQPRQHCICTIYTIEPTPCVCFGCVYCTTSDYFTEILQTVRVCVIAVTKGGPHLRKKARASSSFDHDSACDGTGPGNTLYVMSFSPHCFSTQNSTSGAGATDKLENSNPINSAKEGSVTLQQRTNFTLTAAVQH